MTRMPVRAQAPTTDFYKDKTSVDLGDTRVGDDALEWLGDFPRLEDLAIDGTRVTSEGLSAIEDLAAIRSLRLPATARDETLRRLRDRTGIEQLDAQAAAIGDEGLRELRQLTRLKTLDLRGTLITDRGLPHLRPLEALENLGLAETRVTDKGLSYLGELERLATVDLRGTLIDDAGIRSVQRWSELTRVSMGRCCLSGAVTAQSIVGLGALRNLASLHVHGAHLTDSDVEAFSALPIRELNISQTRMTSAGAEALQRLLPEARIAVNDSHGPVAVFPAEQSFGRLFIRSDDAPQADWIPFGEAKGLIHLPEHHEVRLAWDSGNDRFATLSDTTLERITSLKVLSESEDLGSALEQLGRLRNLTELDLSGIEIPSAVLDSLRLPESLNILRYRNGHVTTQWIAHAAALPHITELDLSLSELNPQAQRDLAALAGRLTALHLAGVELESTFLDDIPAQTALEYVDLEGAEIDGSTVRDFQERRPRVRIRPPQSPHRMLRFPDAAPSGEIWWRLPDPRGLAAWRYIGNAMGEVSVPVQSEVRLAVLQDAHEPFRHVNEWPENSLHSLSLVGRTVSAGELRAIAGLASLRRLDLSGGDLPLDALHHLASLTSIEVLAFADTALDNEVLANMGAFPALRALDLSDTVVSDISTDTLLSIASLRYLHLEGTRFTDEGVGVLRRGLPDTFVSFRPRNPSARASAQPDPVFRFPEIPLPGVLFIQSPDSRQGEWEEVGRICCGLAVDARTRRKLVVSARDANDLSAFNLLPPNAFHEIVFEGSPHIGATGLAPIRNLADLEAIRMISATIEPGALAPIADLAHLSTVQLYAARLDDDDLAYLRGLTQLTDLDLTAASVTDDLSRAACCANRSLP